MKFIKLFESFNSSNPVISANGDWSRISIGGTPINWVYPSTFEVTYYLEPSDTLIRFGKNESPFGATKISPDEAIDAIMGGDQEGSYILRNKGSRIYFLADPKYSPLAYKKELEQQINDINADPELWEIDMCQSLLDNLDDPKVKLTPEFLSHCKAVVSGSELSKRYIKNNPRYYSKHPEILPDGDKSQLKIMTPRISLDFKVSDWRGDEGSM